MLGMNCHCIQFTLISFHKPKSQTAQELLLLYAQKYKKRIHFRVEKKVKVHSQTRYQWLKSRCILSHENWKIVFVSKSWMPIILERSLLFFSFSLSCFPLWMIFLSPPIISPNAHLSNDRLVKIIAETKERKIARKPEQDLRHDS